MRPGGVAFLSCCAVHCWLGARVAATCTTSRVPRLMMKKAKSGLNHPELQKLASNALRAPTRWRLGRLRSEPRSPVAGSCCRPDSGIGSSGSSRPKASSPRKNSARRRPSYWAGS